MLIFTDALAEIVDVASLAWTDRAACLGADPELFFPAREGDSAEVRRALAFCRACPVTAACLAWAVQNREVGIWGGQATVDRDRASGAYRGGSTPPPRATRTASVDVTCGSDAGALRHRRNGEIACDPCRAAASARRAEAKRRRRRELAELKAAM